MTRRQGFCGRRPGSADVSDPTPSRGSELDWKQFCAELDPENAKVIMQRAKVLLQALGSPAPASDLGDLDQSLIQALSPPSSASVWLTISAMTAVFPDSEAVLRTLRAMRLDGPIRPLIDLLTTWRQQVVTSRAELEIVSDQILVDVHHTSRNLFATGIQRVARELTRRWARDHDVVMIGWTESYRCYRRLLPDELAAVLTDIEPSGSTTSTPPPDSGGGSARVLVPWKCAILVPELPAEPDRAQRFQALTTFSGSTTGLIGYDCVPLTSAETADEGMVGGFAYFLAAARDTDRIATISEAAGIEFRGWRKMLSGAGRHGPDIRSIPLAVEAKSSSEAVLAEAKRVLTLASVPLVLSVGSHEPRKNHLAILTAAEELWTEGLEFTLAFVGGNSWRSERFYAFVERLRQAQRPIQIIRALPDEILWAAYRIAYCTVFPSVHEGFGLPVAESLACGTPVITSNFGSMKEIADHGGAVLIDPRDDHGLAQALRTLLTDTALRDRLAAEALAVRTRSWDEYAAEAWAYLVDGAPEPVHR